MPRVPFDQAERPAHFRILQHGSKYWPQKRIAASEWENLSSDALASRDEALGLISVSITKSVEYFDENGDRINRV